MRPAPYTGVGLALPSIDALGVGSPVLEAARAAEASGLAHVWVPDHLVFHRPILESVTALAAVAGATERVGLGFAILNPVLRPVTWLAKQLATLAVLAPGRVMLGAGLGGEYAPEFAAAGVPRDQRGKRLDEALALLPRLMRGEAVEHHGVCDVDCSGLAPVPEQMPPVLVGGRSNAALRRAARHGDAWLPMWMDADDIAASRERLDVLAAEHGRPAPGVVLVAFVNVTADAAAGRAEAAEFVRRQYGMPFDVVEHWAAIGDAGSVAETLSTYRDAGVDGFVLAPASRDPLGQVERLAEVRAGLDGTAVGR
jgi:alkanesulfonate monooxygenase SsuD/methylene tetrahydromethanopterin reductase-like flavin-dependent oxidoreductase (luciferase family)